jgi:hypothetical protein
MGRVWVLDTETKGTGAQMVPLEKALKGPAPEPEREFVLPRPRPTPPAKPEPRPPRRFKVVDVMTRQVLAEGASARETVDLLKDVRSVVDVSIYVWDPKAEDWRQLSQREKNVVWRRRGA